MIKCAPLQHKSIIYFFSYSMKKVVMTIQDDLGNTISETSYSLGTDTDNLSKIEASVEGLRGKMLGDLTKELLKLEQSTHEKKVHLQK